MKIKEVTIHYPIREDFFVGGLLFALEMYYPVDEPLSNFVSFYKDNTPPALFNNTISPEKPSKDDEISVTATIYNEPELTHAETLAVTLYYSTDDMKTWSEINMDGGDDERTWAAVIPPLEEPATVYYFFKAEDANDNYYLEIPTVKGEDESVIQLQITDKDNRGEKVTEDLNLNSTMVRFDGDFVEFDFAVEGDISGGSAVPMDIHLYSVGIFVPKDKEDAIVPNYILVYSKLGNSYSGHGGFFRLPTIGLLDVKKFPSVVDQAGAEFTIDGDFLKIKMRKDALPEKNDFLKLVFGTARKLGNNPNREFEMTDMSAFCNVRFVNRSFEVASN